MTSLQQTAMGGGSTTDKTASYVLVAADAGTVVQMNSASATTITVNTALFAAGDTVQIQNVGAGVCTVTAGTATVSTSATLALKQYDAGSLYFNTTSAAIFFAVDAADGMANVLTTTGDIIYSSSGTTAARLGIGSSAQVLTVASGLPSWATPAVAASGLTKITSASFSGVANTGTTFDGVFTSTYNNYLVVMSNIVGTSSASLYFQWRKSGPTTHTTNYYGNRLNDGVNTTFTNVSQNTLMLLESEVSHLTMNVAIDGTPTQFSYIGAQRLSLDALSGSGTNDTLGANLATGFILSSSSGNIGGFIAVYGLAD